MESDVNGYGFLSEVIKCSKVDCGKGYMALWITKNHWVVHFTWVDGVLYELYLNKTVV